MGGMRFRLFPVCSFTAFLTVFFGPALSCTLQTEVVAVRPPEACGDYVSAVLPLREGASVVACGLAPGSSLFAVADDVAFTLTRGHTIRSTVFDTGVHRNLHPAGGQSSPPLPHLYRNEIFFQTRFQLDTHNPVRVVAVPAQTVTEREDARLVGPHSDDIIPNAIGFGAGRYRYSGSTDHSHGGARTGPIVELDLETGDLRVLTEEPAVAVGATEHVVYYCRDQTIWRVSHTGAEPAAVVTEIESCAADVAVDDEYVYLAPAETPYEIWRFGPDESERLYVSPEPDPHLPLPPPARFQRDENWLYFVRYDGLYRVELGSPSEPERIIGGLLDSGPVIFDASSLYIAVARGGVDEPLETVVVRIAKSALVEQNSDF